MVQLFHPKWELAVRVFPVIALVAILKIVAHYYNWEFFGLNALFAALISANIFLIGFNISGVLADFKEGEKLPAELASNIEAIADECVYVYKGKKAEAGKTGFFYCLAFTEQVLDWLYKKVRTKDVMEKIAGFTNVFLPLEQHSQPSSVSRLKHEQSEIRKSVLRIHFIREVRFAGSAYAAAEIISYLMVIAMIFLKMDYFYENLFFTLFVSFIMIYMLFLIRDLDDPFAYYDQEHSVEEVSLHSLENLKTRLEDRRQELN
jgi:hypothetical protein